MYTISSTSLHVDVYDYPAYRFHVLFHVMPLLSDVLLAVLFHVLL